MESLFFAEKNKTLAATKNFLAAKKIFLAARNFIVEKARTFFAEKYRQKWSGNALELLSLKLSI